MLSTGVLRHSLIQWHMLLSRRLTVPLSGDGDATMSKLMKNDSEYTFSELPRINPHYKVTVFIGCTSSLSVHLILMVCTGGRVMCYLTCTVACFPACTRLL